MGELRNGLVVRAADAVIVDRGQSRAAPRLGLALRPGKPVIGLGTWAIDGVQAAVDPGEAVVWRWDEAGGVIAS